MTRQRRFLALSRADRRLLLTAALLLAGLGIALRLIRLRTLLRMVGNTAPSPAADAGALARNAAWAVNVASRHLPVGRSCLARALATQVLLLRGGCRCR